MLAAASQALADFTATRSDHTALLPSLSQARDAAREIALAVGTQALQDGVCDIDIITQLPERIDSIIWQPHYCPLRKIMNS